MPERICISVLFPAPFSPTRAWTSPSRKSKSTRSSTTFFPKRLVTLSNFSVVFACHRLPAGRGLVSQDLEEGAVIDALPGFMRRVGEERSGRHAKMGAAAAIV